MKLKAPLDGMHYSYAVEASLLPYLLLSMSRCIEKEYRYNKIDGILYCNLTAKEFHGLQKSANEDKERARKNYFRHKYLLDRSYVKPVRARLLLQQEPFKIVSLDGSVYCYTDLPKDSFKRILSRALQDQRSKRDGVYYTKGVLDPDLKELLQLMLLPAAPAI